MYRDVPVIQTYEQAEQYYNKTARYSKGRNVGLRPVGNRNRGWINMRKGDDCYQISFWYGLDSFKETDRTITYYKDNPNQAVLNVPHYCIPDLKVMGVILGAYLMQYQRNLWWVMRRGFRLNWEANKTNDSHLPRQIFLGLGKHVFENGSPIIGTSTMTKTYLKRKEFNALYKKCKPFVDYLTLTNKMRDEGFSPEEVDTLPAMNFRLFDPIKLAESTNMDDHYLLARIIASSTNHAVNRKHIYYGWQSKSWKGDDLTLAMLDMIKHMIKISHAKDLFYQKEVEVTGFTKDSNKQYATYLK